MAANHRVDRWPALWQRLCWPRSSICLRRISCGTSAEERCGLSRIISGAFASRRGRQPPPRQQGSRLACGRSDASSGTQVLSTRRILTWRGYSPDSDIGMSLPRLAWGGSDESPSPAGDAGPLRGVDPRGCIFVLDHVCAQIFESAARLVGGSKLEPQMNADERR